VKIFFKAYHCFQEVFDVEDDGKEFEPAAKGPTDADYFAALDREELDWYSDHVQDHNKKLQCTSCFKQVSTEQGDQIWANFCPTGYCLLWPVL
jgi:hypothetical protein